jgi:hypothetical protein
MKNIIKYFCLVTLLGFVACEDDDTLRIPKEFEKGPNVRIQLDPDFSFIDFDDLENAKVRFTIYSESANLDLVELRAFYTAVDGSISDTATVASYTQADFDVANGIITDEVTAQEIVNAIGLENGLGSLQGGDSFTFLNRTRLQNGTVYPSNTVNGNSNVTPNIQNAAATTSFTSSFITFVGCPSDVEAFVGTYTSEIIASNFAGFVGSTNDEVTIRFIGPEPFRYEVSDISSLAYVPFGGSAYPGDIYDICGNPQMLTTNTFGTTVDEGGGTWDPNTGTLTLNLFETFNGLTWTVVFTKQQ